MHVVLPFSPEEILFVVVFVCVGRVFVFFVPFPSLIVVTFILAAVGIRCGIDDVLRKHQVRLIDLEVSHVLTIVGLNLLFFVVLTFATFTVLVSRFVAIAAGISGAITQGRLIGLAFAFLSTFIAFARPFAFVHSLSFLAALVVAFGVIPPSFTFFIVVSSSSIVGRGGVVGHGRFGRRIDQLFDLEFRVTLETFVGEQFHHLVEGKCAFDVSLRTGGLDRVIGTFRDAVQEPVDTLFFSRGVKGVVV